MKPSHEASQVEYTSISRRAGRLVTISIFLPVVGFALAGVILVVESTTKRDATLSSRDTTTCRYDGTCSPPFNTDAYTFLAWAAIVLSVLAAVGCYMYARNLRKNLVQAAPQSTPGASDDRPSPGWNPDPYGRHEMRYFDGLDWRPDVCDAGVVGTDDPSVPPPPPKES
jgi:heme exporter protein D